jgi:mannose/fructose/N-acetylgalactosamine-specific phosphotransferase system component IIC
MISTKWILLGITLCILVGLVFSDLIAGLVFGALTILIFDAFEKAKKKVMEKKA